MGWMVHAMIPGRVKSYSVFQNLQTGSKTTPLQFSGHCGSFLGVKRPECEADHSLTFSECGG
jgi:hypothetical protein